MIGPWAAAAILAAPFQARPVDPTPRDPRVFRSVLDERARMISVELWNDLWIAYDASDASVYGVWIGGVDFQGAVYDTVHGPQPTTTNPLLIEPGKGPEGEALPAWRAVRVEDGVELAVTPRYRGYRLVENEYGEPGERRVELWWQLELDTGALVDVRERPRGAVVPTLRPPDVNHSSLAHAWFVRDFVVSGLPTGVALRFPTGVWESGDGAHWTGTACAVSGSAGDACAWDGADSPFGDGFGLGLESQREALQAAQSDVGRWEAETDRTEWVPSFASLERNGPGLLYLGLHPFELSLAEESDE